MMEINDAVAFVESLPARMANGRKSDYSTRAIADALKQNPGVWALVMKGRKYGRGHGSFPRDTQANIEVACRKNAEGTYDIYARWIEGGVVRRPKKAKKAKS